MFSALRQKWVRSVANVSRALENLLLLKVPPSPWRALSTVPVSASPVLNMTAAGKQQTLNLTASALQGLSGGVSLQGELPFQLKPKTFLIM